VLLVNIFAQRDHVDPPLFQQLRRLYMQSMVGQAVSGERLCITRLLGRAMTPEVERQKGLWELDNILRSIYILDFIDDPTLRQSVQKALNRGEAYQRMRRAISYVNSGKFRVKTEAEQQIWNECSLLIANAIIYYNTLLLSRVYEQKLAAGDLEAVKVLKRTSPVAWRNVNLIGNFDFTTSSTPVDMEALAARYQNEDFWRRSMTEGDDDSTE
jgi:hypothetical protein